MSSPILRVFALPVFGLLLSLSAGQLLHAQDTPATPAPQDAPAAPAPDSAPAPAPAQIQAPRPQLTVQARIKARREQRRVTAIHDVYGHLYELYIGTGYLRFFPGPGLKRTNEYPWNVGVSRYYSQRFGVTLDGRGIYGTPFVGLHAITNGTLTDPAIAEYTAMIGPTYRFVLHPRYSVSGRLLGGMAYGNFSSDLGTFKPTDLNLYPDGYSVALSASVPIEYNVSPSLGLRIAPEYLMTNFGSAIQHNRGFTGGIVYRWGKQ